ncbi:AraC family transcriptional regulator [Phreatobacter sp. AB_2022a]|uniref:AraC family transcriptional regulator n=1 Tax=Phreatobacter sp. AB_2022a TaxID=3003134 RepID=UPI00228709E3|nr:AraC family transcriptional regulator [Phreatobacter sp. AB_2022a]MCZ0733154.1 AraC family transcriptional regulator ligand-binding domain-containing protein [Phreatobacter sp. AB_2022a]
MRLASSPWRTGASVSGDLIQAVVAAAVAAGVARDDVAVVPRGRLIAGPPTAKGRTSRLPEHALMSVWDAVLKRANGDHGVGALLALHADIGGFGVLGEALRHAPTLLDAFDHVARYARLSHQGVSITVDMTGSDVAVGYALAGAAAGAAQGARASGLLWAMGNLALIPARAFGTNLRPKRASFACPAPLDIDPARAVFGAAVSFDAPASQIIFDRNRVDEVRRPASTHVLDYLDALADQDLAALPAVDDIIARVAAELRTGLIRRGVPTVRIVAQTLGMSARTLQRRIAAANTTFESILDTERKARAKELILQGGRTMGEIADMLGYSEQASFSRAAQRWFAVAPSRMAQASTS